MGRRGNKIMILKSKTFLNHKDLVDFVNKNICRNDIQEIIKDGNYYILFYWEKEGKQLQYQIT